MKRKRIQQRSKDQLIQFKIQNKKDLDQARQETFKAYTAMTLYVLNKEFGIGASRASTFLSAFYEIIADVAVDNITFDEIYEYIYKKLGIRLEI